MGEICYTGSHGTSLNRYRKILGSGFSLGSGRAGNGIYFWVESYLYLELAKAWFKYKNATGEYNDERKPECVVLIAEIKTNDTEYLDLEDMNFKNYIYQLGLEQKIDFYNAKDVARLHNLFITKMEQKLGHLIKMLTIRVAPPRDYKYPIMAIGAPLCCVARTQDCVTVKDYKSCKEV